MWDPIVTFLVVALYHSYFNCRQPMHLAFHLLLCFTLQENTLTEFLRTYIPSWPQANFHGTSHDSRSLQSERASCLIHFYPLGNTVSQGLTPRSNLPPHTPSQLKPWLFSIAWHWGLSAADMRLLSAGMSETRGQLGCIPSHSHPGI